MRAAEARAPVWPALAALAVTAALANLAASLLGDPRGLELPEPLFSVLAAGLLLPALELLVAWLLLSRLRGLPREPLLAALAAVVLWEGLFDPLRHWWDAAEPLRGQTLLFAASHRLGQVCCGFLAWRLARDAAPGTRLRRIAAVGLRAAPWWAAAGCAYVFVQVRWIGSWLSPASLAASAGLAALCGVLAVAAWRWPRASFRVLTAALAGAVLAPAAVRLAGPLAQAPPRRAEGCAVLLSVDTLRADAMRAYAADAEPHPHLDALLDDSLVFLEARSAGPWTKPAMASALTGLSPWTHGANDAEALLPEAVDTLAERLRAAGHRTVAFGRNSFLSGAFGFDQGFDRYEFSPRAALGASSGARLLGALSAGRKSLDTRQLTDRAVDWVRREAEPPFFLWLHYFDPHLPYRPPAAYAAPGPAAERIGASFAALREVRSGALRVSAAERRWIRELYAAELRYVDAELGRFLAALRERGLYDACHVAFLSDHGEEFWEHGGYEHGHSLYDELLRVPFALKPAQASHGGRIGVPVSTASLFATLLELAGLPAGGGPPPAPSLVPLWRGAAAAPPEVVSTGTLYGEPLRSVVFDGYKYIEAADRHELYALESDPAEQRPLYDPAALRRARALLAAHERSARQARSALGLAVAPARELDPELRAELGALGYLD